MIIKEIKLNNIQSYSDEKIDFQKGSIVIYGDNGVGKSTILRAIYSGLFQTKGVKEMGLNIGDLIRTGSEKGSIKLKFESKGKNYSIEWEIEEEEENTTTVKCTLESKDNRIEGVRDVRKYIHENLGFTANSFLSASYVYQNQLGKILNQGKDERQSTIDDLLGLNKIEEYKKRAIKVRRELKSIKKSHRSTIEELESQIENYNPDKTEKVKNESKTKVDKYANKKEKLQEKLQNKENKLEYKKAEYNNIKDNMEEKEKLEEKIEELETEINSYRSKIEKRKEEKREKAKKLSKLSNSIGSKNREKIEKEYKNIKKKENEIKEDYEEIKQKYNTNKTKLSEIKNKLENQEDKKEKLERKINELEEKLEEYKKDIQEYKEDYNSIKNKIPTEVFDVVQSEDLSEDAIFEIISISTSISKDYEKFLNKVEEKFNIDLKEVEGRKKLKNKTSKLEDLADNININRVNKIKRNIDKLEDKKDEVELKLSNKKENLSELKNNISKEKNRKDSINTKKDNLENKKDKYENKLDEIKEEKEEYENKLELFKKKEDLENDLQNIKSNLKQIKDTMNKIKDRKSDFEDKYDDYKDFDGDNISDLKDDIDKLEKSIKKLENQIDEVKEEIKQSNKKYIQAKQDLESIENLQDRIDNYKDKQKDIENRIDEVNDLIELYDRMKSEQRSKSIAGIRKYANEVFKSIYTGSTYNKIEIDKDYEIRLIDNRGESIDPELASGGEKVIIGLSIRSAIYKLISDSQDKISPPFMLDEPTTNLDVDHVDEVRRLLDKLDNWGVEQLFIISHEEDLVEGADISYKVKENKGDSKVKVIK